MASEEGYTLLEMLVAIALVALMSLPLSQGIKIGIYTWQNVHLKVSKQEQVYLLRQRLKDWIASSYPFDVMRHATSRLYPLTGTGTTLTLVASLHPDPRVNILYRTRFELEDKQLRMGYVPDYASYGGTGFGSWAPLLQDVESFEVSYLDRVGPGNLIWVSNWFGKARLPVAVRIRIALLDKALIWPDLIVPLHVDQWAQCVLDSGGTCEARDAVG